MQRNLLFLLVVLKTSLTWSISNNAITDEFGRQRIFHGINAIYKSAPYIPFIDGPDNLSFNKKDAELLQKLGLNVVRLGVLWAGVEPIEGQYNMTYIDQAKNLVNLMNDYGIYVIIDQHQDKYSEMFCGEGFPYWTSKNEAPLGFESLGFPWPAQGLFKPGFKISAQPEIHKGIFKDFAVPSYEQCHEGFEPLISWSTARAYENLYTNKDGLQDKFTAFFRKLAVEFKGMKNVIGYELLNEPNFSTKQISIFPGLTDKQYLQTMYDKLSKAILEIDPQTLIFFEPTTWSNEYPELKFGPLDFSKIFRSELDHAPNHNPKQSVFAYHYYKFINFTLPMNKFDDYFKSRQEMIKKFGVAGFVTEWEQGQIIQKGDSEDIFETGKMDKWDDHLLSWTSWELKSYVPLQSQTDFTPICTGCGHGLLPDDVVETPSWQTGRTLARSYAHAVAGQIFEMKFIDSSNEFSLIYNHDVSIKAPTVIYVNTELGGGVKARYESGFDVTVSPENVLEWKQHENSANLLEFSNASNSGLERGIVRVTIDITPKKQSNFDQFELIELSQ